MEKVSRQTLRWLPFLLVFIGAIAASCWLLTAKSEKYIRATNISYLGTADAEEDVQDVILEKFEPTHSKTITLPAAAIWFRVKLPAELSDWKDGAVFFTGSNEATLSMQSYLVSKDEIQDLGFCDINAATPSCPIATLQYAFPIRPADIYNDSVLYLKVEPGAAGVNNEFYFMQPGYFSKTTALLDYFVGATSGIAIFVTLLSLIFYVSLRETSFLVYALFHFNFFLSWTTSRGIWDAYKPDFATSLTGSSMLMPIQLLAIFFDLLFLKTFFQIQKTEHKLNLLSVISMVIILVMSALCIVPNVRSVIWMAYPYALIISHVFALIILGYYVVKKRDWAVPVAVAWSVVILFNLMWLGYRGGTINGNWFFGYVGILGRSLEAIILNAVVYQKLKSLVLQILMSRAKLEEGRIIRTLLRTLSHDLSNTTQVIQMGALASLDTSDLAKIKLNSESILNAATAQSQIIVHARENYLRRGGAVLNLTSVDLKDSINQAVSLFALRCEMKGVKLIVEVAKEELRVEAEAISLTHQVLANLLSNAVKFTPAGKSIHINARPVSETEIELQVIDEGIGMPKEIRDQIFGDQQISRPGTENESGTGHGLLIIHDFLNAFGARLAIQNGPLGGTMIRVVFRRSVA